MNPQTLRLAYKTGKAAYGAFTSYRDRKTAQAYEATSDVLNDAAKTYRSLRANAQEFASEVGEEIGTRSQELVKDTKQAQKKLSRLARRKAKKLEKRVSSSNIAGSIGGKTGGKIGGKRTKKTCLRSFGKFALLGTLFSAVAGVVYLWWATRPNEKAGSVSTVGTEPPRVEEHAGAGAGTESRLVYSTQTPTELDQDEAALDAADAVEAAEELDEIDDIDDIDDAALDDELEKLEEEIRAEDRRKKDGTS